MHQERAGGARRRPTRCVALAVIAAIVLLAAGCSSDDDSDTDAPTSAPLVPMLTTTVPGAATPTVPDGSPPTPPGSGAPPPVSGGGESSTSGPSGSEPTSTATTTPSATPSATATATTVPGPPTLPPTTTSTTTTSLLPTTTTTLVTEGAAVLVANATDVQGAAGRLSQQLRDRGFTVADPTNAAGYEEYLDVTKVYAVPEAEPVARSIALLLGGVPITQMPIPAPIVGATASLGDAGVLVMLGADRAGAGLPPR